MKTKVAIVIFFLVSMTSHAFASDPLIVPEKVRSAFGNSFPEVTHETWHKLKHVYEVSFYTAPKTWCRIYYLPDGSLIQTFKYYQEEGLPLFIRTKLGKEYPGMKVIGVTEVYENGETTYDILLQDDINIFEVAADHYSNLTTIKKLTRSK